MKRSKFEKLRRRVVRVGLRTSKRVHHKLSREDVLALRVQIVPLFPRILTGSLGVALIVCGWFEWPSTSGVIQGIEFISGLFLTLFAIFGIRRTLDQIVNQLDLHTGSALVDTVIDEISGSIDF